MALSLWSLPSVHGQRADDWNQFVAIDHMTTGQLFVRQVSPKNCASVTVDIVEGQMQIQCSDVSGSQLAFRGPEVAETKGRETVFHCLQVSTFATQSFRLRGVCKLLAFEQLGSEVRLWISRRAGRSDLSRVFVAVCERSIRGRVVDVLERNVRFIAEAYEPRLFLGGNEVCISAYSSNAYTSYRKSVASENWELRQSGAGARIQSRSGRYTAQVDGRDDLRILNEDGSLLKDFGDRFLPGVA